MPNVFSGRSHDAGKLILRIVLGGILLFHGVFKITHGVEWMKPVLAQAGLPGMLAYGAYVGEVVAPVLLIVGYQVRIAALIIAFDMLMAIGLVLRNQIFSVKQGGGGGWAIELEALLLLVAVALVFLGGGKYGIGRTDA